MERHREPVQGVNPALVHLLRRSLRSFSPNPANAEAVVAYCFPPLSEVCMFVHSNGWYNESLFMAFVLLRGRAPFIIAGSGRFFISIWEEYMI